MLSTDKGLTKEQLAVKRQWQDAHQKMVQAINAKDAAEVSRLSKICDSLLPKFSRYAPK